MKKVLIVDDTKNIRSLLSACLELEGYQVGEANDGKEALDKLQSEEYDLVFLDIKLPEISGTEVLRKARALGIDTPVVIMTAFATVKNAVECTKLGAVQYLQKPFTAGKVRSVINELKENVQIDDNQIRDSKRLIDENKLDEAYDLLKKGLCLEPENAEIYYLMGKILEKKGNFEKAEKFFNTSRQFSD